MATETVTTYRPTSADVRATLQGIALAAHAADDLEVLIVLTAAASRLVGKQVPDPDGFGRIVDAVAELHMVSLGLLPDGIAEQYSPQTALQIATSGAEESVLIALEAFGA